MNTKLIPDCWKFKDESLNILFLELWFGLKEKEIFYDGCFINSGSFAYILTCKHRDSKKSEIEYFIDNHNDKLLN